MKKKGIAHTLFLLEGRTGRGVYWGWMIFLFIAHTIVYIWVYKATSGMDGVSQESVADGASSLVSILLLWPSIAITVKRWHDVNKSGMWVLINLIPILGWIYAFIYNGFIEGTSESNQYGLPD